MDRVKHTAEALAALGHEVRLEIFRLLVQAGRDGLNVGQIGAHLKRPPSTLAHHISTLVAAGLVIQERRGREVINKADFDTMNRTVTFLTEKCCAGVSLVRDDAA
jgi:DNA-binding transcriptional ArsR family regulator